MVILTDNEAGTIVTPITARVYLCLVERGKDEGSFADKSVVPHSKSFQLKLKA